MGHDYNTVCRLCRYKHHTIYVNLILIMFLLVTNDKNKLIHIYYTHKSIIDSLDNLVFK